MKKLYYSSLPYFLGGLLGIFFVGIYYPEWITSKPLYSVIFSYFWGYLTRKMYIKDIKKELENEKNNS